MEDRWFKSYEKQKFFCKFVVQMAPNDHLRNNFDISTVKSLKTDNKTDNKNLLLVRLEPRVFQSLL